MKKTMFSAKTYLFVMIVSFLLLVADCITLFTGNIGGTYEAILGAAMFILMGVCSVCPAAIFAAIESRRPQKADYDAPEDRIAA